MASEQSFGNWLRQRRHELDLTREELARQVGCSTSSLRKLEAEERRPSKQMAERLADVLQVAPDDRPTFLRFARGDPFAAPAGSAERPFSVERPRHNLPAQLSSFVGREKEIAEVKRLLATPTGTRLLTLTGSGGSGKTRLALQVAADLVDQRGDGVWLVELAALADPALVARAVAATFDLIDDAARTPLAILVNYLRPKDLLLILDNCEHLVAACAQLAEQLLRAAPNLCVLATSREPLGLVGESIFHVPSLSLPEAGRAAPEALAHSEAGRLFTERATAAQPGFSVTDANAQAMVKICRRLDGIPLALELAAARVRTMPAEQIAGRLDDRFRLLTGGSRTALPRQQTLRALIEWSWDLLTEPERVLLRRLAAFIGGWTLDAAEAVGAGVGIETADVLDLLSRLVDKSLVLAEDQEGQARYRLLETVRQYARDRLLESGELERVGDQHLDFFVRLAEAAEPKLRSSEQLPWWKRLDTEHGNLRAALDWSLERGAMGADAGLRLAGALSQFWTVRDYYAEGREWLTRVLELPEASAQTLKRAKALNGAAFLAYSLRDLAAARALYEESLLIWRAAGPRPELADALRILGNVVVYQGDPAAGQALLDEVAMSRGLGDDEGAAWTLLDLGQHAYDRGENDVARAMRQEGLALHRKLGYPIGIAFLLSDLGSQALAEGDLETAQPILEESLALCRILGDRGHIAELQGNLGLLAIARGDYSAGQDHLEESLAMWRDLGDRPAFAVTLHRLGQLSAARGENDAAGALWKEALAVWRDLGHQAGDVFGASELAHLARRTGHMDEARRLYRQTIVGWQEFGRRAAVAHQLECLAFIARAENHLERAARLLGAAGALREAIGTSMTALERIEYDREVALLRGHMDEAAYTTSWAEGRALGEANWDRAVAEALRD